MTTFTGLRRRMQTVLVASAGAAMLASCGMAAGSAAGGAAEADQIIKNPPAKVQLTPSDQSANISLDAPVQVAVTAGHLDSVTLHEAGGDDVAGTLSTQHDLWTYAGGLDSNANYVLTANAVGVTGTKTTVTGTFTTITAAKKLTTDVAPDDGSTVGVGQTINLRFNNDIPDNRKVALLQRITVASTPGVVGAWHWLDDSDVHFRTQDYWPSGTKVTVTARLNGFDAGSGVWGLGNWTRTFTVGDKHVSQIDDKTHQMLVYQNDQLINTWPVSMGKSGFETLQGTLTVLYKVQDVKMQSCNTFGGAACIPGTTNYYNEDVYWDTAISTTGFYIHAAPWDIGDQGVDDVSHGCVNLSTDRATAFFKWSQEGDVVVISNTGNTATYASGEGDWQIAFPQYDNTNGVGQINTGSAA